MLSGLCGVGVAGLAGCTDSVPGGGTMATDDGEEIGGTDRTIKIGTMLPLSGPRSTVGESIRDAAVLPIEQVRDEVALEIEHAGADTESDPAAAVQAAASLVDEGYPMVTGPLDSDIVLQVTQQVLIPYQTVCCSPGATTPTITTLNDGGLVFRTAVSDSVQGTVLAEIAATDLGGDSAATLYVNNDYGWQLSQAFSRSFRDDHGGTITEQIPIDESATSYAAELDRAADGDPDVLVLATYPEMGETLFSDLGAEYDADVLVTDGLREGDLHDLVDHSLDGIRGTAPLIDGPGSDAFADLYADAYGADPGLFESNAYDASAVLLLANAYAGQNDGRAIQSAIRAVTSGGGEEVTPETLAEGLELAASGTAVEYRGASNETRFDENGDTMDTTFEYWEFDESADGGIAEIDRITA